MRSGELYNGAGTGLNAHLDDCQVEVQRINAIPYERSDERRAALEALLGGYGPGSFIRPPFYCDFGDGITIGRDVFINSNCTMLDTGPITIGDECLLATQVQLVTATHPVDPGVRRAAWEYSRPVVLGDGVWLGAGVIVCPGVTIGDNSVIGAGAVVTRDIPPGVVAYGNPARVIRDIGEQDRVEPPSR